MSDVAQLTCKHMTNYIQNLANGNALKAVFNKLANADNKTQSAAFGILFGALIIITLIIAHACGVKIDWRA